VSAEQIPSPFDAVPTIPASRQCIHRLSPAARKTRRVRPPGLHRIRNPVGLVAANLFWGFQEV